MLEGTKVVLVLVVIFLLIIAFAVGVGLIASYFEAEAFNEMTGENVSTWQAMFVELRVQEQVIEPNEELTK